MICANNIHVSIVSMLDSFIVNTIINTIHHKLRIYVNSKFVYVPVYIWVPPSIFVYGTFKSIFHFNTRYWMLATIQEKCSF